MKRRRFGKKRRSQQQLIVIPHNEGIQAPEVRVVDDQGMIGVMPTLQALELARERELDLVLISPKAEPPVAKIVEYASYKYQKEKEEKKKKASAKKSELKILRLSPRIGTHDLEVRLRKAKELLEKGDKVKIEILLKGRERAHADVAFDVVNNFLDKIKEEVEIKVEAEPKKQGARIETIFSKQK